MPREKPFAWKPWVAGIAATVIAALLIGLGSTAWGLYNRVHDLEKENVRLNVELIAAKHAGEKVNEAQQKEIDRLWDSLTDLWQNSSTLAETVPR